jgi:hypothetical protein
MPSSLFKREIHKTVGMGFRFHKREENLLLFHENFDKKCGHEGSFVIQMNLYGDSRLCIDLFREFQPDLHILQVPSAEDSGNEHVTEKRSCDDIDEVIGGIDG